MATTPTASTASPPEGGQYRIQFVPFSSAIESPFWVKYNHLKLETIQLSQVPLPIQATYGIPDHSTTTTTTTQPQPPRWQCQESSLPSVATIQEILATSSATTTALPTHSSSSSNRHAALVANERIHARGVLLGYNTVEAFQSVNKNQLLHDTFVGAFATGSVEALATFVLITHADLKQHTVLYWFGFPTLSGAPILAQSPPQPMVAVYSNEQRRALAQQVLEMRRQQLVQHSTDRSGGGGLPPYFVWFPNQQTCQPLSRSVLSSVPSDTNDDTTTTTEQVLFGVLDPHGATDHPGWPLRNLVAYLSFHLDLGGQTVPIVCYRPGRLRRLAVDDNDTTPTMTTELDVSHDTSLLYHIAIPTKTAFGWKDVIDHDSSSTPKDAFAGVKVTGWELNARGKPGPRLVQLRPLLDATHLAIQAADLNLQLMKWRMIPNLQVAKLQQTKVLLLGAGTLGCHVARVLLGWGIRHFCFVDNGTVNYSNPVRQPLFILADCQSNNTSGSGSGVPKAVAAAKALTQIAADVHAQGIVLSIPMPGHVETRPVLKESVSKLDQLIQDTDVVFLLTDTRESRWLPTVMAAAYDKPLLNAALGLDSWLVMRHGGGGGSPHSTDQSSQPQRLGCYFCNDVVAPENSTKNRTLDQQCTVTRPGLAPIASAMAVELMVSLLHHPARHHAPAPTISSSTFAPTLASTHEDNNKKNTNESSDSSAQHKHTVASTATALGLLPHQIRGSVVTYTIMTPTVPAFGHCTACAQPVIDAYLANPMDLVEQTCAASSSQFLEDLVGLTEFRTQATAQIDELLLDDDDDADLWDAE